MNSVELSRMFLVKPNSDVYNLVREVDCMARSKGLTLSRWQANSVRCSYVTRITYAIHTGERASRYIDQPKNSLVAVAVIHSHECNGQGCAAYNALNTLKETLNECA